MAEVPAPTVAATPAETGGRVSLLHPDRARPLPVRLCDLKPEALRRAALQAAREENDPAMIDMILHAAMCPSDRVFYVSAAAREQLESLAA